MIVPLVAAAGLLYVLTRKGGGGGAELAVAEPGQTWSLRFAVVPPPAQMAEVDAWFTHAGIKDSGTVAAITGTAENPLYTVRFLRRAVLRSSPLKIGGKTITLVSATRAPIG